MRRATSSSTRRVPRSGNVATSPCPRLPKATWWSTTVEVTLKHTGPFAGIAPTGKEVHSHQVFIHRLEDGKITDVWSYGDLLGVLRQLGATLSLP
jgi:ketosteroid isomerase-like protein